MLQVVGDLVTWSFGAFYKDVLKPIQTYVHL